MTSHTSKVLSYLMCMVMLLSSIMCFSVNTSAAGVTPESGNIYYIKNKNSGLYLTVENDSKSNGAKIVQKKGTGSLGQRWIIKKNSNGNVYRFHPATDMTGGVSLEVSGGSSSNGAAIQINANNSQSAQNFAITASGDGYAITTESTNYKACLDVNGAKKTDGTAIIQYTNKGSANQIWYFETAQWPSSSSSSGSSSSSSSTSNLISDGWYYIKNVNSQKYVEVVNANDQNGANVQQYSGNGNACQKWYVTNKGNNYITLKSGMSAGRMMDVVNGENNDGTNIQIYQANNLDPQTFKVKKVSDGKFALLTKCSGETKAVDVNGWSTANGGNIQQWSYNGGACQQFQFEAVGGSTTTTPDTGTTSNTDKIDADGYPTQLMTFVNTSSGTYLTGGSSNNSAVSANGTSQKANRWKLSKVGSDSYRIVNAATGYALAPQNNKAADGTAVVTTGIASNNAQYWKVASVKNDKYSNALNYKLVNYANTNLALTLSGSSFKLSSWSGSSSQCFRLNSYGIEGFGGYCKDMSGNEKASTIGGVFGDTVKVSSVSQLQNYASGSTPYTIVISGDISASSLTKVNVGKNKTFIGSFSNNSLTNIHFRNISSSGNNIYKNITFKHYDSINANDDIQMYISNGSNFWIDHCTFQGHDLTNNKSLHEGDVDKFLYVGLNADYVSVTGSVFKGHKYGLILGYPQEDGASKYSGYPRMTICNNYFYNVLTRAPGLMRYGYFHSYNNFVYDFNLGYTPYTGANIYSEKNYFDKGSHTGAVVDDHGVGGFTDSGSVLSYNISNIKTGSTSWRPSSNYGYATRSANDAKTWCQNYAGAKSGTLTYAID